MNHTALASHLGAQRAIDYIVVVSNEDDYHAGYHHFADKVNRKLKAGYQLLGQPFSVSQALCQAMIRLAEVPAPGEGSTAFQKAGHHI